MRVRRWAIAAAAVAVVGIAPVSAQGTASETLTVRQAVDQALARRASLKADAERVSASRGLRDQARAFPNPEFQFQNENLRPGMVYTRDVDTLAYVVQPLDLFGRRGERIAVADETVTRTQAEYELSQVRTVRDVKVAYWTARGAQASHDLLNSAIENFQRLIDYNEARLRTGTIAEQDVLRVRLEGERLSIAASLADLRASRAVTDLARAIGVDPAAPLTLTDALDADPNPIANVTVEQVIAQRPEMKVARASVEEAQARERLQSVLARPDLTVTGGYKRTQLADTAQAVNTAIAAVTMKVPLFDRNSGNKAAASAEVRRQQDLLDATRVDVLADYRAAAQEYFLRRTEVAGTLAPMREHAANISSLAQAVYVQTGGDVLRLIDAERSRLDAELAWVEGMVAFQQSRATLEAAEGAAR
jgi:outer membrane protein TolC